MSTSYLFSFSLRAQQEGGKGSVRAVTLRFYHISVQSGPKSRIAVESNKKGRDAETFTLTPAATVI